jgi:hypothetical protein
MTYSSTSSGHRELLKSDRGGGPCHCWHGGRHPPSASGTHDQN